MRFKISRRSFSALAPLAWFGFRSTWTFGAETALDMKWRFTKGEKLRYATKTLVDTTPHPGSGGPKFIEMPSLLAMTWEAVELLPDGAARIEQNLERISIGLRAPGMEFDYDSKLNKETPPGQFGEMVEPLKLAMAAPLALTVDAWGEIQAVEFPKEYLEASGGDEEMAQFIFKRNKPLKRLGEVGYLSMAREPLELGKPWERQHSVENPLADNELK